MNVNIQSFNKVCDQIDWEKTTPSKKMVLNALFNTKNIKVVILGQDPYPTKDVANGFAFAVNKNIQIPKSLKQIFKEIRNEFGVVNTDRTLDSWIKQGVLLLNTSLTTKIGYPNTHKFLWKDFTTTIIEDLGKDTNLVWILWGNEAKKFKVIIKSKKIIEDAHPSPLSKKYRNENTFKDIKKYINIKW